MTISSSRSASALRRFGLCAPALAMALAAGAPALAQEGAPPGPPPGAGAGPPGAPPGGPPGPPREAPKLLSALEVDTTGRPPSTDPRNFEGTYTTGAMAFGPGGPGGRGEQPFTEKAAKEQAYAREMDAKGTPLGGLSAICRPNAGFGIGSDLFPGEIVQSDTQVVLLNEEHRTRWNIYLNREHPKDLKPTYFGHSVGHWEGDTLVAETRGFNGKADLLSEQAVVVSRIRKLDGGRRIEIVSTTTDPVNYTRPVERTSTSTWNPGVQVLEFQCEENMEGAAEGLVMDPSNPSI